MKGFSRYNKLLMFSRGVCCCCMFLTDIHWARDCNCEADLGRRGEGTFIYFSSVTDHPVGGCGKVSRLTWLFVTARQIEKEL